MQFTKKLNQCARELETLKLTLMPNHVVRDIIVVIVRKILSKYLEALFYHEKNHTISPICLYYEMQVKVMS